VSFSFQIILRCKDTTIILNNEINGDDIVVMGRECVDPDRSYAPALRAPPLPKRGNLLVYDAESVMNAGAFLKTLPLRKGEYPPLGGGGSIPQAIMR
jgi:hypothetical protein